MTTRAARRKQVQQANRRLSPAETAGVVAAHAGVMNAREILAKAEQRFVQIMKSVGLDANRNWRIEDDGSVTEIFPSVPVLELAQEEGEVAAS